MSHMTRDEVERALVATLSRYGAAYPQDTLAQAMAGGLHLLLADAIGTPVEGVRVEDVYLVERRHKAVTLGAWAEVLRGGHDQLVEFLFTAREDQPDRDFRLVHLHSEHMVLDV